MTASGTPLRTEPARTALAHAERRAARAAVSVPVTLHHEAINV